MLHEALMLEIYRQALNAGALPTARPRSTESAHSSERCPSHDSNSSENGRSDNRDSGRDNMPANSHTFPSLPQSLPAQPPSMEAYLQMVAAAAHQYGFPLGGVPGAPQLPQLPMPTDMSAPFKIPGPQASPTASSNNSEALDFRTSHYGRSESAEPPIASDDEEDFEEDTNDANNPLDLSVGARKRPADTPTNDNNDSPIGKIQVKKAYKQTDNNANMSQVTGQGGNLLPPVNPYLAAVAAANIFRSGQFPDWNGKSDLVVDPLEKMSDIVKGPRKDKSNRSSSAATMPTAIHTQSQAANTSSAQTNTTNSLSSPSTAGENLPKTRHNIWQSHWQNKGVASSVFRCVWCKQSFPTLEALTTHMKDSKHCGVNVPPFGNMPNADRNHQVQQTPTSQSLNSQHSHSLRKQNSSENTGNVSAAAQKAFQFRGDQPTPLPRKLVRGQNVWLGKGVEQAMQILKCMRCGESFRSLGDMTKHMQETQHYTNILSQEQTISMKSSANSAGDHKDGQSLSSEESRTLSAVLTCKVCDKAFNSLGDLSTHMAKNNHYAEPLMQQMGAGGHRKRPAPKKREKSLPVRKLLEMKGAQMENNNMDGKMTRSYDNAKHIKLDNSQMGGGGEKSETALFAERMRQYITGIKPQEESNRNMMAKNKSPDVELKNGTNNKNSASGGSSSVLSAIEQMFATSFDTPVRHTNLPASSPSNSSQKNTSPVASNILRRLGIDETVDYNKPLMDTSDPYYQNFRYTSSERSGSECSAETQLDARKAKQEKAEEILRKDSPNNMHSDKDEAKLPENKEQEAPIKLEIKAEVKDEENKYKSDGEGEEERNEAVVPNGSDNESVHLRNSPKTDMTRSVPRSPADSHRSATPKSPESSIKSYDGEKKYPSDSLNALSSMFDSLGSSNTNNGRSHASQGSQALQHTKAESPENLSSSTNNSLSALRQFCVKKEKTA